MIFSNVLSHFSMPWLLGQADPDHHFCFLGQADPDHYSCFLGHADPDNYSCFPGQADPDHQDIWIRQPEQQRRSWAGGRGENRTSGLSAAGSGGLTNQHGASGSTFSSSSSIKSDTPMAHALLGTASRELDPHRQSPRMHQQQVAMGVLENSLQPSGSRSSLGSSPRHSPISGKRDVIHVVDRGNQVRTEVRQEYSESKIAQVRAPPIGHSPLRQRVHSGGHHQNVEQDMYNNQGIPVTPPIGQPQRHHRVPSGGYVPEVQYQTPGGHPQHQRQMSGHSPPGMVLPPAGQPQHQRQLSAPPGMVLPPGDYPQHQRQMSMPQGLMPSAAGGGGQAHHPQRHSGGHSPPGGHPQQHPHNIYGHPPPVQVLPHGGSPQHLPPHDVYGHSPPVQVLPPGGQNQQLHARQSSGHFQGEHVAPPSDHSHQLYHRQLSGGGSSPNHNVRGNGHQRADSDHLPSHGGQHRPLQTPPSPSAGSRSPRVLVMPPGGHPLQKRKPPPGGTSPSRSSSRNEGDVRSPPPIAGKPKGLHQHPPVAPKPKPPPPKRGNSTKLSAVGGDTGDVNPNLMSDLQMKLAKRAQIIEDAEKNELAKSPTSPLPPPPPPELLSPHQGPLPPSPASPNLPPPPVEFLEDLRAKAAKKKVPPPPPPKRAQQTRLSANKS